MTLSAIAIAMISTAYPALDCDTYQIMFVTLGRQSALYLLVLSTGFACGGLLAGGRSIARRDFGQRETISFLLAVLYWAIFIKTMRSAHPY